MSDHDRQSVRSQITPWIHCIAGKAFCDSLDPKPIHCATELM